MKRLYILCEVSIFYKVISDLGYRDFVSTSFHGQMFGFIVNKNVPYSLDGLFSA